MFVRAPTLAGEAKAEAEAKRDRYKGAQELHQTDRHTSYDLFLSLKHRSLGCSAEHQTTSPPGSSAAGGASGGAPAASGAAGASGSGYRRGLRRQSTAYEEGMPVGRSGKGLVMLRCLPSIYLPVHVHGDVVRAVRAAHVHVLSVLVRVSGACGSSVVRAYAQ